MDRRHPAGDTGAMSKVPSAGAFPGLLKTWRSRRRLSQLDLALEAGMSQRHISFLETGRSSPSRQAIARLGDALNMPCAEVDSLLAAAGFAARSADTRWSADAREAIKTSIDHVLKGHEPYPAVSIDRMWTLQSANSAAVGFFMRFGDASEPNVLRAIMKPGSLRSSIVNWDENVRSLIRLFELEVLRRPSDTEAQALLNELLSFPGVEDAACQLASTAPTPVLTLQIQLDEVVLSLFSLIATIGMSADATLDDLRIETLLPADDVTRDWFHTAATPV